jgi:hypothetical protein
MRNKAVVCTVIAVDYELLKEVDWDALTAVKNGYW